MPVVAGIDEAGYGPTLGPLCLGATVWRVAPQHVETDFWNLLRSCVRRAGARGDSFLKVDDSKEAYDRKRGIGTLERAVLAFASQAGLPCGTLSELRASLGCPGDAETAVPWEAAVDTHLPADPMLGAYQAIAQRLDATCERASVRCFAMMARVVSPERFNRRLQQTDNKAAVLVEQVLDLLAGIARAAGDDELHVCVDHLGGRTNYRELLMSLFPQRQLTELEVTANRSVYELRGAGAALWRMTFVVEADRLSMPVALASMTAKYLRELVMDRFNAYWRGLLPELRPTAGYYGDARRFLSDIRPALPMAGIPLDCFVRRR